MALQLRDDECFSCFEVREPCHFCGYCSECCKCPPHERDFTSEWAVITELRYKLNKRTDEIIATLNHKADRALLEALKVLDEEITKAA